jgi:hypothetical protein
VKLGLATGLGLSIAFFPAPLEAFLTDPANDWAPGAWGVIFPAFWIGIALSAGTLSILAGLQYRAERIDFARTLAPGAQLLEEFDLTSDDQWERYVAAIVQVRHLMLLVDEAAGRSQSDEARAMLLTTSKSLRMIDAASRRGKHGRRPLLVPVSGVAVERHEAVPH